MKKRLQTGCLASSSLAKSGNKAGPWHESCRCLLQPNLQCFYKPWVSACLRAGAVLCIRASRACCARTSPKLSPSPLCEAARATARSYPTRHQFGEVRFLLGSKTKWVRLRVPCTNALFSRRHQRLEKPEKHTRARACCPGWRHQGKHTHEWRTVTRLLSLDKKQIKMRCSA